MDTIGRYSVLDDQAGEGVSSGWRKAFSRDLRCYAALKVISKTAFPNEESHEDFAREVQVATRVRHHSLAAVFPLETISNSYLYAMEFCDGERLTDRVLATVCFDALDALEIVKQIASGLEAASAAGLIHRDISADNIVLLEEDDEIAAKLMGLALPFRSASTQNLDFRSPEEIGGKELDVRSEIFSLGAILYFMVVGREKYALFRNLMESEAKDPFADADETSHRVAMVVRDTVCHDPKKRISTFVQLIDLIERARTAPEPSLTESVASVSRPDDIPAPSSVSPAETYQASEVSTSPEVATNTPITTIAPKSAELRPGELMIPPELLKVAQAGRALRLSRIGTESPEEVAAHNGNCFRIGRMVQHELVTRFLPRNKANDLKSKRLSKTQVTAKCEGKQILLFDGSRIKASANGSAFEGKALSHQNPFPLVQSGELKLAGVYSIKVIPLLKEANEKSVIANLGDWIGPITQPNPTPSGAIVFIPYERSEVDVSLWLFSMAMFGLSGGSLNFTLPVEEPLVGALRYFGGYFWIEQKSTEALLVNDLRLGVGEIAPLTTGQTIEVTGVKYMVDIQDEASNKS